ncbi:MAG TPA: succinate dehydrogenase, cytochrome b556 subunit [Burkholderiales bacterium]|nr:succinate dehydrogenase, cytochrome b556 subunit [Burkholderiales bacterium]
MTHRTDRRPVFFDLLHIQMPVGALTSITHRVTGVLLAVGVPVTIYLLDLSVRDADGYAAVIALFDRWYVKCGGILLIWSLAHHLLAGIRHLLSDIDVGSQLHAARRSAWTVNLAGLAVAFLAAAALL